MWLSLSPLRCIHGETPLSFYLSSPSSGCQFVALANAANTNLQMLMILTNDLQAVAG